MSCVDCYYCKYSLSTRHNWKCKLMPRKRFNVAALHGWFCKHKIKEVKKK